MISQLPYYSWAIHTLLYATMPPNRPSHMTFAQEADTTRPSGACLDMFVLIATPLRRENRERVASK